MSLNVERRNAKKRIPVRPSEESVNMQIRYLVFLQGSRGQVIADALIDTGAEVSMMSTGAAQEVGAWLTNYNQALTGIHGDTRTFPVVVANIEFSALKVGGRFAFAMSDFTSEVIIGMDVLKPLGISVDTASHELSVKNPVWEAFKTLAAIGVIVVGGVKLLEPK